MPCLPSREPGGCYRGAVNQPPGPQGPYPQWGQQPGQPQPWGQQPGGPQPGQWGQQPGQWQQPPQQQPDPELPPIVPPPEFPGYDPFDDMSAEPKKSKLPWILGGVGVLVVAGVAVLLIVLLGGDSGATKGSSAQETAESFAAAFNDRSVEGIKSLLCDTDRNGDPGRDLDSGKAFEEVPENGRVELAKVVEDGPGKAKAHYDRFIGDQREDNDIEVPLVEKDGVWEICVGGEGTP